MRFDIVTLFPELFAPHLTLGVTRRAFESRQVDVRLWQLRDFADDPHRRVDDRPYGGGPGMVMLAEPLERVVAAIRSDRVESPPAPLILFSPAGRRLDQALVRELALGKGALLLCGRYEGVDQRFIDERVDLELSLGDFVLSGGEVAALALLDAVTRLQPGVLNDELSHLEESFESGLLEAPHYSRPEVWHAGEATARAVPAPLLSGHHAEIARWRRERALEITSQRRPDLIVAARAAGRLTPDDERFLGARGL